MVEPGKIICPARPELNSAVANHLDKKTVPSLTGPWTRTSHLHCLVDVEDQADGVAQQEHDHDGEKHGGHGGVPAVALGYGVVNHRGSENS